MDHQLGAARRWMRARAAVAFSVVMVAVVPACSTSTASGGGTTSAGGCPENLSNLIASTEASYNRDLDRSQLSAAWWALSSRLAPEGVLDLCEADAGSGLGLTPPASMADGALVRVRPVIPSPFDPEGSIAAQVVYVTEADNGVKAYAMTLMAIKASDVIAGNTPDQVVWAHGTAGINGECDQAVDASSAANFLGPLRGTDATLVPDMAEELLAQGEVVNAPYYIGIGTDWAGHSSPYLSRDTTGRTVIDAVRAVASVEASKTWGVIGHSQGGQAALAAADLAPSYGAGLHLVGAVGMAPPLNPEATFDYWLDSVAASATGTDPRPDDGAPPPDIPSVMTLAAHLFWGLSTDVTGVPDPSTMLNRWFRWDARDSVRDNTLALNPVGPSLINSGDAPAFNSAYGVITHGPSAVPDSNQVPLITPSLHDLSGYFADLDWNYTPWSVPRDSRVVIGCGWNTNGASGGVLYQYVSSYRNEQTGYPAGMLQLGMPMIFQGAYTDPHSSVWDGLRSALRDQNLVDHKIDGPLLITSGDLDSLLPTGPPGTTEPHTMRANIATMCANGSQVQLLDDPTGGHGEAFSAFDDVAVQWIMDRFDGQPIQPSDICTNL
jgi:pimeloyl-ACP methyl ester carboxylesterase